ncbi:MAG TPA: hypothetical protein VI653_25445 [Steroidobacteraceae bacterium]
MRIFDTFMFDGELTLLRYRLAEIYDLVDYFVLVEARRTYSNQPKPLIFAAQRAEFAWAAAKIRSVALDGLGGPGLSARERAACQRNATLLALRDATPDDVVLLLDADEIPSRSFLLQVRSAAVTLPCRLAMTRHYEFLDALAPASPCCPPTSSDAKLAILRRPRPESWDKLGSTWFGQSGVAVTYADLTDHTSNPVRDRTAFSLRFGSSVSRIAPCAGRHLSAVDPASRLEHKLPRVFHTEHAIAHSRSSLHLARCRKYGVHHSGWWYSETPRGTLPADLARLAASSAELRSNYSLRPMLLRRLVCAWAWLRLWKRLPACAVTLVDRYFAASMVLLGGPLLALNMLRSLDLRFVRRLRRNWQLPRTFARPDNR